MDVESKYLLNNPFDKKTSKALNFFWTGFILYTMSYVLMISNLVPSKIIYLQLLGMLLFLFGGARAIKFRIANKYLKVVYTLYFLWLLYVVKNGFQFNPQYLFNTAIDGSSGLFLYLSPLILLFPRNFLYLKKIIFAILILSIIYVIYDGIFIGPLLAADSENGQTIVEYFAKNMGIPAGFLLLTIVYHNSKKKFWGPAGNLWALFVVVLTFLLAVIRARRGMMFMTANMLLATYLLYNYAHKSNLFFKFFPIVIIFFVSIYAINVFTEKKPGAFSLLTSKVSEDTRSDVETYFHLDMEKKDWIMGRGIDGIYYCPTGATLDGYRGVIETDYLQIILKGGLISLGLLLLIAIPAIIKGFFYSNNILTKAAATWILLGVVASYPATIGTFSLNYLLIWISIGICYSKEIRDLPESYVREHFQFKLFNPKVYKNR